MCRHGVGRQGRAANHRDNEQNECWKGIKRWKILRHPIHPMELLQPGRRMGHGRKSRDHGFPSIETWNINLILWDLKPFYHDLSDCQPLGGYDDNVTHVPCRPTPADYPDTVTRYDLIYLAALPVLAPYLLWRRVTRGKYTQSASGMLGRKLRAHHEQDKFKNGSIWIHAVSVGEVSAARAVSPGLKGLYPKLQLVISTITETGQVAARDTFPSDITTFFPADWSGNVDRFLDTFNPRIFVLMETELWPNFLTRAAARGTDCYMINAKLSDRSFPRYRRFRGFFRPALESLKGICTQTAIDAERFRALGIPDRKISVTGNCKLDVEDRSMTPDERIGCFQEYGMNPYRRWIVAGSTHAGEEQMLLESLIEIRKQVPEAAMLLCPRHPERFDEVAELAENMNFRVSRISSTVRNPDAGVVLLDRMGSLARAYGLGELAVVAGSFCKVGGHNLMEAAVHGIPVIFGPRMHSQREILRIFHEAGAGMQVEASGLARTITGLFMDERLRIQQSEKSREVIKNNRGSARKAIESIRGWLNYPEDPVGIP
jgi:3-deoxy-D-manno-octulosonic-acid transferase